MKSSDNTEYLQEIYYSSKVTLYPTEALILVDVDMNTNITISKCVGIVFLVSL
jgi:hypothetical protein